MTSSINFKKLVSVGAALLLALGGSLVATEPASAAVTLDGFATGTVGAPRVGDTKSFAAIVYGDHGTPVVPTGSTYQWLTCTGTTGTTSAPTGCANSTGTGSTTRTYTVVSADLGKYLCLQIVSTFASYPTSTDYLVSWATVAAALAAPVVTPGTPATSGLGDTSVTLNYSSDMVGNLAWSVRAAASAAPTASYLGAWTWGVLDLKHGQGALMSPGAATVSVTGLTAGSDYIAYLIVAGQAGPSNVQTFAFTTTGGSNSNTQGSGTTPLTPEQAKNQIKPLPTIVQPLVAALPSLSKPLVDAGGKVDLKSGDFTGLVSASISGKPLAITVGSTGSLSLTVPSGQAGTTADLLLNFKSGTVIIQDAIKYVAPVVVAQVPVRFVSIKAGAKTLSPAAADSVRLAAFANLKNNSIECVAYAASAATVDAAKATAQQACDLAVKANPDLVNTNVSVVVDKAKAATQGVGIKVYKQ